MQPLDLSACRTCPADPNKGFQAKPLPAPATITLGAKPILKAEGVDAPSTQGLAPATGQLRTNTTSTTNNRQQMEQIAKKHQEQTARQKEVLSNVGPHVQRTQTDLENRLQQMKASTGVNHADELKFHLQLHDRSQQSMERKQRREAEDAAASADAAAKSSMNFETLQRKMQMNHEQISKAGEALRQLHGFAKSQGNMGQFQGRFSNLQSTAETAANNAAAQASQWKPEAIQANMQQSQQNIGKLEEMMNKLNLLVQPVGQMQSQTGSLSKILSTANQLVTNSSMMQNDSRSYNVPTYRGRSAAFHRSAVGDVMTQWMAEWDTRSTLKRQSCQLLRLDNGYSLSATQNMVQGMLQWNDCLIPPASSVQAPVFLCGDYYNPETHVVQACIAKFQNRDKLEVDGTFHQGTLKYDLFQTESHAVQMLMPTTKRVLVLVNLKTQEAVPRRVCAIVALDSETGALDTSFGSLVEPNAASQQPQPPQQLRAGYIGFPCDEPSVGVRMAIHPHSQDIWVLCNTKSGRVQVFQLDANGHQSLFTHVVPSTAPTTSMPPLVLTMASTKPMMVAKDFVVDTNGLAILIQVLTPSFSEAFVYSLVESEWISECSVSAPKPVVADPEKPKATDTKSNEKKHSLDEHLKQTEERGKSLMQELNTTLVEDKPSIEVRAQMVADASAASLTALRKASTTLSNAPEPLSRRWTSLLQHSFPLMDFKQQTSQTLHFEAIRMTNRYIVLQGGTQLNNQTIESHWVCPWSWEVSRTPASLSGDVSHTPASLSGTNPQNVSNSVPILKVKRALDLGLSPITTSQIVIQTVEPLSTPDSFMIGGYRLRDPHSIDSAEIWYARVDVSRLSPLVWMDLASREPSVRIQTFTVPTTQYFQMLTRMVYFSREQSVILVGFAQHSKSRYSRKGVVLQAVCA